MTPGLAVTVGRHGFAVHEGGLGRLSKKPRVGWVLGDRVHAMSTGGSATFPGGLNCPGLSRSVSCGHTDRPFYEGDLATFPRPDPDLAIPIHCSRRLRIRPR